LYWRAGRRDTSATSGALDWRQQITTSCRLNIRRHLVLQSKQFSATWQSLQGSI